MSLTCVSLAWLYLPKYRSLTLLSSLASGMMVVFTTDISTLTHGRWDMWIDSIKLLDWSWVLGTGFGGFSAAYPMVKSTPEYIQSSHLHMEYMEWFIHTGLFGLLLLLRVAVGMIKGRSDNDHQNPWWGIVSILLLASLVDFPLQLNALALLFVIALGQVLPSTKTILTPNGRSISLPVMCALIIVTTLIGPNVFSKAHPHPVLQSLESQAAHHPLDPTVLEQVLWTKIQSLDTKPKMPGVPNRDTGVSRRIKEVHPVIVKCSILQSNIGPTVTSPMVSKNW